MSREILTHQALASLDNNLAESLSALMDGEIDELSLKRLLNSGNTEAINKAWQSLTLQQQNMQEPTLDLAFVDVSILAGVQQGIGAASDPQVIVEPEAQQAALAQPVDANNNQPPWFKPLANFAVAASVAVVTVFAVGQMSATKTPLQQQNLSPANVNFAANTADFERVLVVEEPVARQDVNSGRVFPVARQGLQSMVQPVSAELNFDTYQQQNDYNRDLRIQQLIERHKQTRVSQ